MLLGGTLDGAPAQSRRLDLECPATCEASEPPLDLPAPLTDCQVFGVGVSSALLLCAATDEESLLHAFAIDLSQYTVEALPLREPRRGAAILPTPNSMIALLGGEHADGSPALTVEMLVPDL